MPLEFVFKSCADCTSFVSSTLAPLIASPEILSVTMTVYRTGMRSFSSLSWRQDENMNAEKMVRIMREIVFIRNPFLFKFNKKLELIHYMYRMYDKFNICAGAM